MRAKFATIGVALAFVALCWQGTESQTTVANNAANLSGKTILAAENSNTVSGLLTFSRGASAPFAVVSGAAAVTNLIADTGLAPDYGTCDLRLTLTSGTPYTTSDVTAATNVYVTPLKGGRCGFYDGSKWTTLINSEQTVAVPNTTGTNYDIWCRNNSGSIACDATAWSSDTARATALSTQNNIYIKSGDSTRRYIGTFRTTGVAGQTEDSTTKRYVWSYYNRARRPLYRVESTASWTYTTATIRQANGSTSNQVDVVTGVSEDVLNLQAVSTAQNAGALYVMVLIGEDSTTAPSATQISFPASINNTYVAAYGVLSKVPGVGRHYYTWLEYSQAVGTTTWYAGSGGGWAGSSLTGGIFGSSTN